MMRVAKIFGLAVALTAVLGCSARTDKTDGGGIILSVAGFGTLPLVMSASGSYPYLQIDSIDVRSIVQNPGQGTSDLMRVEIQGYEVTYERVDTGTRLPPRLVERIFGTVDPGGTYTLLNGVVIGIDQFNHQPLKDLLDFGKDTETNSTVVRIKIGIRFFGKTISGDSVETQVATFTLDIVP
jgi:hypothetical protein